MTNDVALAPHEWDSGPPVARERLGVWLFLAAEALFFAALLAAHVVSRAAEPDSHAPVSSTLGVGLTLVLGACSLCAALGTRARRAERVASGVRWTLAAAALALAFVAAQALEWRHLATAGFLPRSSLLGSSFFVVTGAHGLHVLAGAAWLAFAALSRRPLACELATTYQHFVDFVWLVILLVFYT